MSIRRVIFCSEKQKLTDIDLDYLRKNIAIVLQDVFLFSDTIFNNVTLGDKSITREQVIEAAKEVGVHDFIERLPGGYDYQVGERGGVLSVGQRQLISFIRAYVYNPHILILDEATSSVDNESEEMIQNATLKLTKGRTSIVIAHRLSTIQTADKIIVLIEVKSWKWEHTKNYYVKTVFTKICTTCNFQKLKNDRIKNRWGSRTFQLAMANGNRRGVV